MNKIKVTRKEFEEKLLDYNIGKLRSFRLFKKGQANTNYLLNTTKGKYVCKIYNVTTAKSVLFIIKILNILTKNDIPCIKVISSNSNNLIQTIKDKPSIIYEFVQGRQINRPNKAQFLTIVQTMAKLHTIDFDFNKNSISNISNNKSFHLEFAKKAVKELKDSNLSKERLTYFKEIIESVKDINGVPKGIIHGDFSQENILFNGDKISAVIDFDGKLSGYFISDIASLIYFWAWFKEPKRKLNLKKTKKLLELYQQIRPLTKKEKTLLYDTLLIRTLIYLSWNMNETKQIPEYGCNYFDYFKSIVEQVTSIGRDKFYKEIFD